LQRDHVVVRACRVGTVHQIFCFQITGFREQQIGVFGARRHVVFNHDDGFAKRLISDDFTGAVDIPVLIQQGVTGLIEKQLNSDVQLIDAFHAHGRGGHFLRRLDRISPQVAGN